MPLFLLISAFLFAPTANAANCKRLNNTIMREQFAFKDCMYKRIADLGRRSLERHARKCSKKIGIHSAIKRHLERCDRRCPDISIGYSDRGRHVDVCEAVLKDLPRKRKAKPRRQEEGKVGFKKSKIKKKRERESAASDFMADIDMGLTDESADSGMGLNLSGSSMTLGGAIGTKGTQRGSGGLGQRGYGIGGGGTADGLGGMGSKGTGRGSSGYGTGGGSFGKKKKGKSGRIGGTPVILGNLDKSLIKKVINRNMNRIRYCYQRQLSKNPTLAGKVKIKFTIAKTGSVAKAKIHKSSLGSTSVDSCLVSVFRRMKFPKPKGGGIVVVKYPFIFGS